MMNGRVNSIENSLLLLYILIKDISFNISWTFLKFGLECHLEGRVSQIFCI